MAETVGELLVKLGVDPGDARKGIADFESQVTTLKRSAEDASTTTTTAFKKIGASAADLGKVTKGATDLAPALKAATGGAETLGRDLTLLAAGGELSGERLLSLAGATTKVSAGISTVQAVAPGAAGGITDIGLALLKFSPLALAGGLAVKAFQSGIENFTAAAKARSAEISATFEKGAQGIKALHDQVDQLKFNVSVGGLSEFQQQTEQMVAKVRADAEAIRNSGGFIAQGTIEANIADIRKLRDEMGFLGAASESRQAGAALHDSIRQGVDDALAELGRLERSNAGVVGQIVTEFGTLKDAALPFGDAVVKVQSAEQTLQGLRDLGKQIDFKGPVADLQKLQTALDESGAKIRNLGAQAGFSEDAIQKEIQRNADLIKQRFSEDQKIAIHIDPTAANAEVGRFLETIGAKPVTLKGTFDLSQAVRELDVLRAKIADTPDGELKIALQAEASKLESKIAEERAKAQQPATMPVDADTSAAQAKVEALRKAIEQENAAIAKAAGFNATASVGAAGADDIKKAIADAVTSAASAIKSGDVDSLRKIQTDLKAFVQSFGITGGQRTIPTDVAAQASAIQSAVAQALRQAGASGFGGSTTVLGTGVNATLASALNDFRNEQRKTTTETTTTNALLQQNTDVARQGVTETRNLSTAIKSGSFASDMLKRQADAARLTGATR